MKNLVNSNGVKIIVSRIYLLNKWILACISILLLSSCGGGGGGGGGSIVTSQPSVNVMSSSSSLTSSSSYTSSSSSSVAPLVLTPIIRDNLSPLSSAVLDTLQFIRSAPLAVMDIISDPNLQSDLSIAQNCENVGGTLAIEISESGKKIQATYVNCTIILHQNNQTLYQVINGSELITRKNIADEILLTFDWNHYSVVGVNETGSVVTGTARYQGTVNASHYQYWINAELNSDSEGTLKLHNVLANVKPQVALSDDMTGLHLFGNSLTAISGQVELVNKGVVSLLADTQKHRLVLGGSNAALGSIEFLADGFRFGWDENGDGLTDAGVYLPESVYLTLSKKLETSKTPRWINPGYEAPPVKIVKNKPFEYWVDQRFTQDAGALLNYKVTITRGTACQLNEIESGHYKIIVAPAATTYPCTLSATATNNAGETTLAQTLYVWYDDDTDNDGLLNLEDFDDDNDGVVDNLDLYPLDPNESKDTDKDGVGDNADTDRDNDGILNAADAYPLDPYCYKAGDGNGESCYAGMPIQTAFIDKRGVVYFSHFRQNYLIRWDSLTKKYLTPLYIGQYDGVDSGGVLSFSKILYSEVNDSIYIYYGNSGDVTRINPVTMKEGLLFTIPSPTSQLAYAGKYLVVLTNDWQRDYAAISYDNEGNKIDEVGQNGLPFNGLSFYSPEVAPFCSRPFSVDANGKFVSLITSPYPTNERCYRGAVINYSVSADGSHAFLPWPITPSGIYNRQGDNTYNVDVTYASYDAKWVGNNLIFLDGNNQLNLSASDGTQLHAPISVAPYANVDFHPEKILVSGNYVVFLTKHPNAIYSSAVRIVVYDKDLKFLGDSLE